MRADTVVERAFDVLDGARPHGPRRTSGRVPRSAVDCDISPADFATIFRVRYKNNV